MEVLAEYYGALLCPEPLSGAHVTLRIDLASPPYAKGKLACSVLDCVGLACLLWLLTLVYHWNFNCRVFFRT